MAKSGVADGPLISGESRGVKYFHKGNRFCSPYFIDMAARTKECSKCREIKPFDAFYKRSNKPGLLAHCKNCTSTHNKTRRGKYYRPEDRWNNHLKSRYKLTQEQYDGLVKRADNRCECCGNEEPLFIDHCHKTGKVRGLICRGCNSALGYLKEDISRMEKLIDYARRHK